MMKTDGHTRQLNKKHVITLNDDWPLEGAHTSTGSTLYGVNVGTSAVRIETTIQVDRTRHGHRDLLAIINVTRHIQNCLARNIEVRRIQHI